MTVIDPTRAQSSFTGVIAQTIAKFSATFAAWNDKRATHKALSALSDRELDDIGLSRADIDRIGIYH